VHDEHETNQKSTFQNAPGKYVAALAPYLHRIKAFEDNYLWMLQNPGASDCWLVDPGDAQVLIEAAELRSLQIVGILLTHHHADHQGGVEDLIQWAQGKGQSLRIFGPRDERIHPAAEPLDHDAIVDLGFSHARVIAVPGHTRSHIAYYFQDLDILFCGDCMFAAGCGRIFEGSPAQMLDSLIRLSSLPGNTLLCCAHEYTLANLRFARAAHPEHPAIEERFNEAQKLRQRGVPTVPSLLMHEFQTNPFLLDLVPQAMAGPLPQSLAERIERFAALRAWKNEFRA